MSLKESVIFGIIVISNMNAMVVKEETYHLPLNKIETYLKNIIINFQNSDTWKFQLTIAINFISSKDAEEERVMHSGSDNMKSTSYEKNNPTIALNILYTKEKEILRASISNHKSTCKKQIIILRIPNEEKEG